MPHQPFTLAVTPDGKTLYVTGGFNLLTPIRTSTNHPGTPIVVGVRPAPSPSQQFVSIPEWSAADEPVMSIFA